MKTVILGFSGGVDSAVAALLLRREGYDVRGAFLDVCANGAAEDAIRTAEYLRLPLEVIDARSALETCVCAPFAQGYLRGETLNPCLLCNPAVKLRTLLERADAQGAEYIATGHYARLENGAVYMGCRDKDQSYQLATMKKEQLARLLLPLGALEKPRNRRRGGDSHRAEVGQHGYLFYSRSRLRRVARAARRRAGAGAVRFPRRNDRAA